VSLSEANEPQGFAEIFSGFDNIATPDGNVLTRLDAVTLCDALRRLPVDELAVVLQSKLVPLVNLPGLQLFAACGLPALAIAEARGMKVVAYAEAGDLIAAARAVHGRRLLYEATSGLARRSPAASARRRLTGAQIAAGTVALTICMIGGILLPLEVSWVAASVSGGLFFLAVLALRILCLLPPLARTVIRPRQLEETDLPVYSVLVPLFRETAVLGQLLTALTGLKYPPHLLDIKLILEENDILMQRAVAGIRLPPQFEVIVVPSGKPQTKPRALNYGLQFCRGQLLTIYDAEDVPEPDQLWKAAECFAFSPPDLACLQAQLVFYNPNENWLTRQFTIEYGILFGILLPMLANHRLPLLLGGTSNHFRTHILRRVGAWDPYNVTEDADLGLRLARQGYDTATLDSRTYEEATTHTMNWMRQRARWLKGFLATWLVHMREPGRLWNELGPAGFWAAQAMTIGVFASSLLHPLCLIVTVVLYAIQPLVHEDAGLWLVGLAGLNLLIFVAGYVVMFMLGRRALQRRGIFGWPAALATMPLYWFMMSFAAWYALWQFIAAPFHWNKTEHGLSSVQRRQRNKARNSAANGL
jgi:cellulose synthase/poly-beta-1,6-N-acetylglucosamine synthase-like glycosyltransferase